VRGALAKYNAVLSRGSGRMAKGDQVRAPIINPRNSAKKTEFLSHTPICRIFEQSGMPRVQRTSTKRLPGRN